jgi:hypothetical protein
VQPYTPPFPSFFHFFGSSQQHQGFESPSTWTFLRYLNSTFGGFNSRFHRSRQTLGISRGSTAKGGGGGGGYSFSQLGFEREVED